MLLFIAFNMYLLIFGNWHNTPLIWAYAAYGAWLAPQPITTILGQSCTYNTLYNALCSIDLNLLYNNYMLQVVVQLLYNAL
jgi:hypothetical protein